MGLPSLESPALVGKGNEFHDSAVQIPGLVVLQHSREGAPASLGKEGLFAVLLAKGMAVLSRDTLDSSVLNRFHPGMLFLLFTLPISTTLPLFLLLGFNPSLKSLCSSLSSPSPTMNTTWEWPFPKII